MKLWEAVKARSGFLLIGTLGIGLLGLHLVHAVGEGEGLWTFLFGIFIPLMFTIGLFIGGMWLWQQKMEESLVFRVGLWCLFGAIALSMTAYLIILYEQAESVVMSDHLFVMAGQASIGSVIGFTIGLYEVRQRMAREHAEQLNDKLTVLNRVLRHDIRNRANVIQGRADLLAEEVEQKEQAKIINQQAARLVELGDEAHSIEQLLHETDIDREVVDIASIFEKHLNRITREYPTAVFEMTSVDSIHVYAHPLIDVAIANVLENAVEHNDNETPRIEVDCTHKRQKETDSIEIAIADNGSGIPEKEIVVLERGYETPLKHSSGLGLWIVNWLVRESGGTIRFGENSPSGSVVYLQFERSQVDAS